MAGQVASTAVEPLNISLSDERLQTAVDVFMTAYLERHPIKNGKDGKDGESVVGRAGKDGKDGESTAWEFGEGPPQVESAPGAVYLDTVTGDLWRF